MAKAAPRKIGSILNQLMARRGYAQIESAAELEATVREVLGAALTASVRVGTVKRGVLMIYASDSPTMQELSFQRRPLLRRLQADHPQANINDVRFRVSP
jgi:hypothetical protein